MDEAINNIVEEKPNRTLILVSKETKKRMYAQKQMEETWDQLVNRLIDRYENR